MSGKQSPEDPELLPLPLPHPGFHFHTIQPSALQSLGPERQGRMKNGQIVNASSLQDRWLDLLVGRLLL